MLKQISAIPINNHKQEFLFIFSSDQKFLYGKLPNQQLRKPQALLLVSPNTC